MSARPFSSISLFMNPGKRKSAQQPRSPGINTVAQSKLQGNIHDVVIPDLVVECLRMGDGCGHLWTPSIGGDVGKVSKDDEDAMIYTRR